MVEAFTLSLSQGIDKPCPTGTQSSAGRVLRLGWFGLLRWLTVWAWAGGVWALAACTHLGTQPDVLSLHPVAEGLYLALGTPGPASPANQGRVGNAVVLLGPKGVLVVDSGTSYRHGAALLRAVRQLTPLPVRAVLLTHAQPEFIFGAKAFQEAGVPVWMHRANAQLMAARCAVCLERLRHTLGKEAMADTELIQPDWLFDDSVSGDWIGRRLDILYLGHSSGPGDVVVWDARSGSLIAGGLIDHQHVPDLRDGQLAPWRVALHTLAEQPMTRIIPGHGPPGDSALWRAQHGYLQEIEAQVKSALLRGVTLAQISHEVPMPAYATWKGYPDLHQRNLHHVYLALERDLP
ncbi:MAG: MBL fold metallo-hydrolase [Ideonella sp. MAG2]|nr:MAG: MBL fold metallo-hydrolase [Ideonella sp. MAG2]